MIYDRATKRIVDALPSVHEAQTMTMGRLCSLVEGTREVEAGRRITHLVFRDDGSVTIVTEIAPQTVLEQRIAAAISATRDPLILVERVADALRLHGEAREKFRRAATP